MAKTRVYAIKSAQGISMCEAPTRDAAGLSEAIRLGLIESCEPAATADVAAHFRAGRVVHRVGDQPAEGPSLQVEQSQTDDSRVELPPLRSVRDQIRDGGEPGDAAGSLAS